jgi:predicted nucleotidyltransferase
MSRTDAIIAQLNLPTDSSIWTDEQAHAFASEGLKEALDIRIPRSKRNACVKMFSSKIREPEVLSEDLLRKRVEEEIAGTEPAKKNAHITQKGGLAILAKLLDRVEEANKEPFAFSVGAVILFGSWDRNEKPHAGDIDVAIELVPKLPPGDAWGALRESRVAAARKAGRSLPSPQHYYWHVVELFKYLQRGSKGISLADLDQISQSMEPNEKTFSYTILCGDAQAIARKFERSAFGLKACRIRQREPKSGEITTLFDNGTLTQEQ